MVSDYYQTDLCGMMLIMLTSYLEKTRRNAP